MEDKKINVEALNNIYKNAHIGLQSISDISTETLDLDLKEELLSEYEGYEKIIGEISAYMSEHAIEPKDINPIKKAMLWTSIKINSLTDDSKTNIAQLMIKGTVMGITELTQLIHSGSDALDKDVLKFAVNLRDLEEKYEENLKKFL